MQNLSEITMDINYIMHQMNQGNFSSQVKAQAHGDMDTLKQSINHSLQTLNTAVTEINVTTQAMADGDLYQKLIGSYQGDLKKLKEGLDKAQQHLTGTVQQIQASAQSVNVHAQKINHISQELSESTSEQAGRLEEATASMEEMASVVKMNADNANQLSKQSLEKAQEGVKVVSGAIQAMEEINLSNSKISEIISLIDGISFQTNLLALNAAVEAARAGEHGRGFAVVTGEVRNLAQRSAEAAKDIKKLIEETTDKVQNGTQLVQYSGDALSDIQNSINEVNGIVGQIATATQEQTIGINQMNIVIIKLETFA